MDFTLRRECATNNFALCLQIDYGQDEEWNMWVKAGVFKLLSSDANSTCITGNNSNLSASMMSPHPSVHGRNNVVQNLVASTVTPLPESCDMHNNIALNHRNGADLLEAIEWDFQFDDDPLDPRVTEINMQVSNSQIWPGVCATIA
jgi:hypothetical protein